MTLTLEIPEQDEAEAVRSMVGDLRALVLLRVKRPNVTAARIVAGGKLLNIFDEIEHQLPAAPQPEGAGGNVALGA
jgi:hypothetical protein